MISITAALAVYALLMTCLFFRQAERRKCETAKLDASMAREAELRAKLENSCGDLISLQKQLASTYEELATLSGALATLQKELRSTQAELKSTQVTLKSTQAEVKSTQNALRLKEEELSNTNAALSEMTSNFNVEQEVNRSLTEQNVEQARSIAELAEKRKTKELQRSRWIKRTEQLCQELAAAKGKAARAEALRALLERILDR